MISPTGRKAVRLGRLWPRRPIKAPPAPAPLSDAAPPPLRSLTAGELIAMARAARARSDGGDQAEGALTST